MILQLCLAHEVSTLYGPFMQYMLRGVFDGQEYSDVDILRYFTGCQVLAHVDTTGLIQEKMPYFGHYCVFKLCADPANCFGGQSQVLCHMGTGSNQCCWRKSHPCKGRYGGHLTLKCGTIYFMFGCGAYGGPSHALHNADYTADKDTSFGRLKDASLQLVLRPWNIQQLFQQIKCYMQWF